MSLQLAATASEAADLIVELAGKVLPLGLLNVQQPAGESLQRCLRRFAFGYVAVHDVRFDLPTRHKHGHTRDKNVHPAAVLTLTNRLAVYPVPVRYQVHGCPKVIASAAGYD